MRFCMNACSLSFAAWYKNPQEYFWLYAPRLTGGVLNKIFSRGESFFGLFRRAAALMHGALALVTVQ